MQASPEPRKPKEQKSPKIVTFLNEESRASRTPERTSIGTREHSSKRVAGKVAPGSLSSGPATRTSETTGNLYATYRLAPTKFEEPEASTLRLKR